TLADHRQQIPTLDQAYAGPIDPAGLNLPADHPARALIDRPAYLTKLRSRLSPNAITGDLVATPAPDDRPYREVLFTHPTVHVPPSTPTSPIEPDNAVAVQLVAESALAAIEVAHVGRVQEDRLVRMDRHEVGVLEDEALDVQEQLLARLGIAHQGRLALDQVI